MTICQGAHSLLVIYLNKLIHKKFNCCHNFFSIFCHFDIFRSIFCFRYFFRRYFAFSIFCFSIFCNTIFCLFDILRVRYFAIRYFATSIFCDFDILQLWYFGLSISCVRYFAIRYFAFRYFVRNPLYIQSLQLELKRVALQYHRDICILHRSIILNRFLLILDPCNVVDFRRG